MPLICRYAWLPGLALSMLVTACSQSDTPPAKHPEQVVDVSIVHYEEREAGTGPYPVRILVSPEHVRFDDGYDESDFVLFDRGARTLFSVTHENRSVLEIRNQTSDDSLPADITLSEDRNEDINAPAIDGKQPVHVRYLANEMPCYQALSVGGLLEDTVAALIEYETALGERQLNNLQSVPESMQTPCFLSRYAYAPARHYTLGLPLQIWDETGFHRSLTDFQEHETVAAVVFEVPESYESLQMGQ